MLSLNKLASAAMLAGGLVAQSGAAHADNVVARWIELGPGSSASALANGLYGDQPTSLTPTILARAVISGGACPALTVDGSLPITMKQRFVASQLTSTPGSSGAPNGPNGSNSNNTANYPQYFVSASATSPANFPDGTAKATTSWAECEAVVPAGHATATIGGVALRLPIANPQRILVIGDIGCRMQNASQQNCHYAGPPPGFPLPALAAYEAQFKPDLIVEVGDWFYRDTSCVVPGTGEFTPGCNDTSNAAYQTWGDTFDSWNADVFYPANPLLAAAPWVMARGNHESCGRGARGWFALLDPHPFNINQVTCAYNAGKATVTNAAVYTGDFTPTYVVPGGSINFLVHDSSFANDSTVDVNMAKNYDYDLTSLLSALPSNDYYFYVTHKPSYGLVSGAPTNGGDFTEQYTFSGNATANSAFTGGVPYKIALFLSGHIHQFEYVNFSDYSHYAPQLIVGTGGDNLDPTANPDGHTLTYAYQNQAFTVHNNSTTSTTTTTNALAAYSQAEFGFAVLDATATGYIANVYNIYSTKAGRCVIKLNPRDLTCWD
nr:metallophosphoesterase [uncultured Rhodopila sp.]